MPLLNLTKQGNFIFKQGKYATKSLDEVAKLDPDYLTWMWKKLPDFSLDEPVIDHLEDVMLRKGIPFR